MAKRKDDELQGGLGSDGPVFGMPDESDEPEDSFPEPMPDSEPIEQVDEPQPPEPQAPEPDKLDKVQPGGRYKIDGRIVDANGQPIQE